MKPGRRVGNETRFRRSPTLKALVDPAGLQARDAQARTAQAAALQPGRGTAGQQAASALLVFFAARILRQPQTRSCAPDSVKLERSPATGMRFNPIMTRRLLLLTTLTLAAASLTGAARADCIEDAARRFGTNADVLRAIAIVESRVRPQAERVNPNGSIDRGLYQINSIHLPELAVAGIGPADLHDVCLSSHVASMLLKRQMAKFGDTWTAVGAYHSTLPAKRDVYAAKVREVFAGLRRLKLASLN